MGIFNGKQNALTKTPSKQNKKKVTITKNNENITNINQLLNIQNNVNTNQPLNTQSNVNINQPLNTQNNVNINQPLNTQNNINENIFSDKNITPTKSSDIVPPINRCKKQNNNSDCGTALYELQIINIHNKNTEKQALYFLKTLVELNDTLAVPFIEETYANTIKEELQNYYKNKNKYNYNYNYNLHEVVFGVIEESNYFRKSKLYDIIYKILKYNTDSYYKYHTPNHNHINATKTEINDAIAEITCSSTEHICDMINNDIDKLKLYISLDDTYFECTKHNIKHSNFKKIVHCLTQMSGELSEKWESYLNKIMMLIDNKKFCDVIIYLYHIANKTNNINLFNENNDNNNKINYYFNIIFEIVLKSSISILSL